MIKLEPLIEEKEIPELPLTAMKRYSEKVNFLQALKKKGPSLRT